MQYLQCTYCLPQRPFKKVIKDSACQLSATDVRNLRSEFYRDKLSYKIFCEILAEISMVFLANLAFLENSLYGTKT